MKRLLAILMGIMLLVGMAAFAVAGEATFEVLQKGTQSHQVTVLQRKLKEMGYKVGRVDGVFGAKTEAALKVLQGDLGWEQTGIVESQEALDAILGIVKGDGVNLLANTDYAFTKDNTSEAVESHSFLLDPTIDLQSMISKTVTLSLFVNSPGERGSSVEDPSNYMYNRFGCHLVIKWSDSTGTLEDKVQYPCTNLLMQTVDNRRIAESYTIAPPDGYDTLTLISVALQAGARPAEGNSAVWTVGYPKLEEGNIATDWTASSND